MPFTGCAGFLRAGGAAHGPRQRSGLHARWR